MLKTFDKDEITTMINELQDIVYEDKYNQLGDEIVDFIISGYLISLNAILEHRFTSNELLKVRAQIYVLRQRAIHEPLFPSNTIREDVKLLLDNLKGDEVNPSLEDLFNFESGFLKHITDPDFSLIQSIKKPNNSTFKMDEGFRIEGDFIIIDNPNYNMMRNGLRDNIKEFHIPKQRAIILQKDGKNNELVVNFFNVEDTQWLIKTSDDGKNLKEGALSSNKLKNILGDVLDKVKNDEGQYFDDRKDIFENIDNLLTHHILEPINYCKAKVGNNKSEYISTLMTNLFINSTIDEKYVKNPTSLTMLPEHYNTIITNVDIRDWDDLHSSEKREFRDKIGNIYTTSSKFWLDSFIKSKEEFNINYEKLKKLGDEKAIRKYAIAYLTNMYDTSLTNLPNSFRSLPVGATRLSLSERFKTLINNAAIMRNVLSHIGKDSTNFNLNDLDKLVEQFDNLEMFMKKVNDKARLNPLDTSVQNSSYRVLENVSIDDLLYDGKNLLIQCGDEKIYFGPNDTTRKEKFYLSNLDPENNLVDVFFPASRTNADKQDDFTFYTENFHELDPFSKNHYWNNLKINVGDIKTIDNASRILFDTYHYFKKQNSQEEPYFIMNQTLGDKDVSVIGKLSDLILINKKNNWTLNSESFSLVRPYEVQFDTLAYSIIDTKETISQIENIRIMNKVSPTDTKNKPILLMQKNELEKKLKDSKNPILNPMSLYDFVSSSNELSKQVVMKGVVSWKYTQ